MAMTRKEYFRCPDGTITDNIQVYGKAWRELGEFAEKVFPGYVVRAYDPNIALTCEGNSYYDADHLFISPKALAALKSGLSEHSP